MLGVGGTTLSWLLATSGQNQPSPTAQETTRRPLISLLILEVARGQGWRQEKATRIRVEALGAGRTSSSKGPARPPGAGGAGMGWQGRGPPRDRGNLRYPERKGKARGEGAGLGHQSCLSWSWDFRPTGSKAPSPSQELSPQERRWPAAGCTQISRRPGEGHWRALGLLGVLRVPALQVAQVDGLEGLQAGVRDLLHVLLHQAPLAARHLAAQVPLHTLPGFVNEAHILLVGWGEDLTAVGGRAGATVPLAVVDNSGDGGTGHRWGVWSSHSTAGSPRPLEGKPHDIGVG